MSAVEGEAAAMASTAATSSGREAWHPPCSGRKGAAMMRIEAARRLFPAIHFNEPTTRPGLDALGWYHEKIDEQRGIGLGPEHDWASHGADAFGLMCVSHKFPDAHYTEDDEDDERDRGRNASTGY